MVAFTQTIVSAAALVGLVQFCPAPFAAIPVAVSINMGTAAAWVGAVGGIVGGTAGAANAIINGVRKPKEKARDVQHPRRTMSAKRYGEQIAWERCRDDVKTADVDFTAPGPGRKSNHHPRRSRVSNINNDQSSWYLVSLHPACRLLSSSLASLTRVTPNPMAATVSCSATSATMSFTISRRPCRRTHRDSICDIVT